jgi:uncharacterized membrane protein
MASSHILGASLALIASLFFGGGDICGGIASRRSGAMQTLFTASLASVILLGGFTILRGETLPSILNIFWACLAGMCGLLGLIALFKGLASGKAAIVSPISGVVSASLPVAADILTQGMPNLYQTVGFVLALGGIWLVTQSSGAAKDETRNGFWLGMVAGIFFGFFFIVLARIEQGGIFFPLMISKLTGFVTAFLIMISTRKSLPAVQKNPAAVISGVIDSLANALYLVSTHFTRLDVAAVLSSLYPAVTVFLSLIFLKEHVSRVQWAGVALCLAAIALIII